MTVCPTDLYCETEKFLTPMRLQEFPSRLDPEMIAAHLLKIGWPSVEVDRFFEIAPSPETPKLLVSY